MSDNKPLIAAAPLRPGQAVAIDTNGLVHPLGKVTNFSLSLKPNALPWRHADSNPFDDLLAFQTKTTISAPARFEISRSAYHALRQFFLNLARKGKLSRDDKRRVKALAARVTRQRRKLS